MGINSYVFVNRHNWPYSKLDVYIHSHPQSHAPPYQAPSADTNCWTCRLLEQSLGLTAVLALFVMMSSFTILNMLVGLSPADAAWEGEDRPRGLGGAWDGDESLMYIYIYI